jgi:hypothetical protein
LLIALLLAWDFEIVDSKEDLEGVPHSLHFDVVVAASAATVSMLPFGFTSHDTVPIAAAADLTEAIG